MKSKLTATLKQDGYEIHPKFDDGFRIRPKGTKLPYQVDCGRSSGKHARKSFATMTEARMWANKKYYERKEVGKKAFSLTDPEKEDAAFALQIAKRFNASLRDMANYYELQHRAVDHTHETGKLIDSYLQAQQEKFDRGDLRQTSKDACRQFVGKSFRDKFGAKDINTISGAELNAFLNAFITLEEEDGLPVQKGVPNRNSHRRYIGGFFKWVMKTKDVLVASPMEKVETYTESKENPEVYTPEQVELMLDKSPAELIPYMIVQLFCGARAYEATRIKWDYFQWGEAPSIKLPKQAAKKGKERMLLLKPNAVALLQKYRPKNDKGLICTVPIKSIERRILAMKKANGIPSIHSGLRHCFCTYATEQFGIEWTMRRCGHDSSKTLLDHYVHEDHGMMKEAAKFWSIGLPREKVVEFPQAIA